MYTPWSLIRIVDGWVRFIPHHIDTSLIVSMYMDVLIYFLDVVDVE
jgi:hypothetical protein